MAHGNCGELDQLLGELRGALSLLAENPDSDERQCEVCLLTRSAYTEFVSVSEANSEIQQEAAQQLRELFESALNQLDTENTYHKSVEQRFDRFEKFLDDFVLRGEFDTAVA